MTKSIDEIHSEILMVFDKELNDHENSNGLRYFDEGVLHYKSAELLVSYYQNLKDDEEKEDFIRILYNQLSDDKLSALLFTVFYQIGRIDIVLDYYNKLHFAHILITLLIQLLHNNIIRFDNNELGIIKVIAEKYQGHSVDTTRLIKTIVNLRFSHFEKTVQSVNTEINADKKQVEKYLKNFGFEDRFNITLNKLDQYIMSEEGTGGELVPGGVIGILREFFKDFYIDLAKKIANINGLSDVPELTPATTDIGYARQYIKQEFGLSSDEDKLLGSYKDICNNSGSHALLSEKKYLRLARNIGIEIALFMLEKYSDYLGTKSV